MMIQRLLDKYREELSLFFDKVDVDSFEKLFALCQGCKGLLIFSGIGKSALVAEKIAVTMTATGTRALFIPPIEAMHGDVGIISDQDIFIAISKSGETEELLNLLPYVRNKGAKVVALTSNPKSRLAEAADMQIVVPFHQELCPFNMAPTISTSCQTIFGDVLAIALMESKGFTLDEYAMNHPAGTIGKRITVKVKNLMIEGSLIPLCRPADHLIDVLVELSNKKAGCVLVADENKKLLGIFTDGDLRRSLQKFGPTVMSQPLSSLMTQASRFTHPEVLAWDALKMMENQKSPITVLPVLDEDHHVVGLLKLHDILQTGI
jgi:arabinose-5-phosphate isomerase